MEIKFDTFVQSNLNNLKIFAQNTYYQILKQGNKSLLEFYWLNHPEPMTSSDFQQGSKELTRFILLERPKGLLISYFEMNYVIPYDMQLWFIEEIAPSWLNSSLKKIALVINYNLLLENSLLDVINQSNEILKKKNRT